MGSESRNLGFSSSLYVLSHNHPYFNPSGLTPQPPRTLRGPSFLNLFCCCWFPSEQAAGIGLCLLCRIGYHSSICSPSSKILLIPLLSYKISSSSVCPGEHMWLLIIYFHLAMPKKGK